MLQDIKDDVNDRIMPLVSDIAEDAELLIRQEIELLKSEVRLQVMAAKAKATSLLVAVSFGIVTLTLFGIGAAHYLYSIYPELSLGGTFLILAGVYLILSFILLKLMSRDRSST